MKKKIVFLMLTFWVCQGFSQGFNYSINAGLNYSSFQSEKSLMGDFSYKLGYQISFIVENRLNDKMGIRIEPGFVNRGSKITDPELSKSTENLNYFNAPVLISYSPFERFSILLGPEVGVLLSAKSTKDGTTTNVKSLYSSNYDLGIDLGITYRLIDKLNIGFRFNRGIISTVGNMRFFDQNGNTIEEVNLSNQGFSVLLTYMIN
jgi:hypothetical protein